jgi:hypothetical protein
MDNTELYYLCSYNEDETSLPDNIELLERIYREHFKNIFKVQKIKDNFYKIIEIVKNDFIQLNNGMITIDKVNENFEYDNNFSCDVHKTILLNTNINIYSNNAKIEYHLKQIKNILENDKTIIDNNLMYEKLYEEFLEDI